MMTILAAAFALWTMQTTQTARQAIQAPPDTEIYLAPLTSSGTVLTVGAPVNITNSSGYDNQPSFTPDGKGIFFTSIRGGGGTLPDVYRYDMASKTITRVTATPEGEYSPTVTPDRQHISVIRVEADSTQRLWQFTLDGKNPELVLREVRPVGYHVWAGPTTLVLFVLGQPATLQIADTKTGKADVLVTGIGRSLQRVPGRGTISFVERTGEGGATLSIRELEPKTRTISPLVGAVPGAKEADLAWTPDGMLLMANGDTLYGWRRGQTDWAPVADLAKLGLKKASRLAVSPDGKWIAIVATP